jgi:hypothetical protein
MNVHALEATGGYTYSQMGIYTAKPGTPKSQLEPVGRTNNVQYAETDPKTGQPASEREPTGLGDRGHERRRQADRTQAPGCSGGPKSSRKPNRPRSTSPEAVSLGS